MSNLNSVFPLERLDEIQKHPEDFRLLERVWVTYGDQTGNALETLCYNELPWRIARYGRAPGESCTTPISPEIMKSFYKSIYNGED